MKELTISITAPERLLKGAGILNTSFIPSYIYKLRIEIINNTETVKLCSFSSTLGNGIRYLKNLEHSGHDNIIERVSVVEPNKETGNDNVIIFANNINVSPRSTNIISFDIALCDKYTQDSIENTGDKIPHKEKICIFAHVICGEYVDSFSAFSIAHDYEMCVACDNDKIKKGDTTKYSIYCKTGQYDMARSVYIRSILSEGLEFIGDSSNLHPKNVYSFNGRTIIKWEVGSLQPSEIKRIGYMVKVKDSINEGAFLKSKINSNCINNSTYTQCPSSTDHILTVE